MNTKPLTPHQRKRVEAMIAAFSRCQGDSTVRFICHRLDNLRKSHSITKQAHRDSKSLITRALEYRATLESWMEFNDARRSLNGQTIWSARERWLDKIIKDLRAHLRNT